MVEDNADNLVQQVYSRLKEMIVSGGLKPGEKIRQEKMAETLGISRTPLVKAFQILEQELLLESIPRRGMYVRQSNIYDMLDAYECRQGIETTAVRIITNKITISKFEELKSIFDPFLNSKNINREEYLKADFHFHNMIIQISNNNYLIKMNQIANIYNRTYRIGLIREPLETLPEHLMILSAIETKDTGLAEEYMRNHIRKSIEQIKLKIKENKT